MKPNEKPSAAHGKPAVRANGRPTLKDVARALRVSRTTVSNAFNRPKQLSEELREKILRKSRELGYFGPDQMARRLRRRELSEVGVVFHHDLSYAVHDPSSVAFLRGVAQELDARHLALHLIPRMGRQVELEAAFQSMADALIVHAEIDREVAPQVLAADKPLVLVDSFVPGAASVCIEDRRGAALAMKHALAARPDQVLVLSFPIDDATGKLAMTRAKPPRLGYVAGERMAGYVLAARQNGFPMERIIWLEVDSRWPESAAERVGEARSQFHPNARVAIVSMSDRMALAAQTVVRKWRGLNVVAIVGFDDIPAAAAAGLTTIRQDAYLKGQLAIQVLLDGRKPLVMPVELIVRDT